MVEVGLDIARASRAMHDLVSATDSLYVRTIMLLRPLSEALEASARPGGGSFTWVRERWISWVLYGRDMTLCFAVLLNDMCFVRNRYAS